MSFSPGSSARRPIRESSVIVADSNLGVVDLLDVGRVLVTRCAHRVVLFQLLGRALFLVLGGFGLFLHLALLPLV
jgi:hypothetical protein